MKRLLTTLAAVLMAASALYVAAPGVAQSDPRPYKILIPEVHKAALLPTPTPVPAPAPPPSARPNNGDVVAVYLESAGVNANYPVEKRDTEYKYGRETFQDPSHPSRIAWYNLWGTPGWGPNSIFSAHVNYVDYYAPTPFGLLAMANAGDALYVKMADGTVYTYTVVRWDIIPTAQLDMNAVVYPPLAPNRERVTLISCNGNFIPSPSGYGGDYDSRLILIAERNRY
jgi:hypothetical protein